ncbi:DUF305 domain-containing protein [Rhodococcus spelaei]|uniref:DUF305 domain-containing protein n=1 Tax=Rhodococcus spelaei TaxID=2546320 RepID=A0A541B063_9NOCA|nr:DUF305 domain-containing protein [Rhodococcus spelaei]TQF65709.1 DUF305 domain-containing protein [Rhodococcus spelaei]
MTVADGTGTGSLRSQRTALAVLGLIAAIAIGFGLGFLANQFLHDDQPATPVAGSVDVGFAQDMTVHHNQAVEMAAIAIANAADPMVRDLAYDILTTQQNQIGQMTGWLSLWNQPLLPTGDYMAWMTADGTGMSGHTGMSHGTASATPSSGQQQSGAATMPGMASSEDMAALRQARGPAADVLFLQLMLRHHEGGKPMMEYGAQHAEVPTVRALAQTMVDTQQSESTRMTQLLTEKGAAPLPMN